MLALAALDWGVMALYGAVVLAIGWMANRRQRSSEDYFLGGRRLRWWVVGISLVATSFSSVALIGGTGFGYTNGMAWLQLQLGDVLALAIVCVVFLPFFSGRRLTTAYEYLEERFGPWARSVASVLFIGQTLLRTALLVYGPALALSTVLGWDIRTGIVVTASAAIVYSAFGGIAAVVWTDLIQMCVIVFAVLYCLLLIVSDVPGGFGAILDQAGESGRLNVFTAPDRGGVYNVLGTFVPYFILTMSIHGTNQQPVQRYLSCTEIGAARRAAFLGWGVGTLTLGLTLFMGVCLSAWAVGTDVMDGATGNEVLPRFIAARLPAGVAGLMLAAIFAASMSSIDSAIHSMSTATVVDFVRRFSKGRNELRVARWTTVAFGVAATLGALYAASRSKQLLETLVTWLGYFAGPMLGLFLLGMLTKRANEAGALVGVVTSFAGVALVVLFAEAKPWGFHPLWLAPASCASTCVLGYATSCACRRSPSS